MAARFWVGGTGTADGVDTAHISATTGGAAGASYPGSGDTLTFDANSGGGTVTVSANFDVTTITMANFTGTINFGATNPKMQTFNNNGNGVRTLNMGSGTWEITGNNAVVWDMNTTTNLTMIPGTAIVNFTYSGSTGTRTIRTNGVVSPISAIKISAGSDIVSFTSLACSGIDFTGFTGVWAGATTTSLVNGNLTMNSTMTSTNVNTIQFTATSGVQLITSNGFAFDNPFTFNGAGATFRFADTFVTGSSRQITLTAGTLDNATNNVSVTTGIFNASNANVRTLNLGAATWNITGNNASVWNISTATNLTFNVAGSTIKFTYSGSVGTRTLIPGSGVTYNNIWVSAGSDTFAVSTNNVNIVNDWSFAGFTGSFGTGVWCGTIMGNLTLGAGMTWTNTKAIIFGATSGVQLITSNGVAMNNQITFDGVGGTFRFVDNFTTGATQVMTLTNGTLDASTNNVNVSTGLFNTSNANTRVLNMGNGTWSLTGVGTIWTASTATNLTLNAGNSLIVITDNSASAKTFTAGTVVSLTYNDLWWSGSGTGSFTLQGSAGVIIWRDISIGNTGATTFNISSNTTQCRNLTFTGFNGVWASSGIMQFTGNVTLVPTMTKTATGAWTFQATSGTQMLTTAGITLVNTINMINPGSVMQMQDALTSTATVNLSSASGGGFDTNGFNFTCTIFAFNSGATKSIDISDSTVTLTGTGTVWNAGITGTTFNSTNSLIILNNSSATIKRFRPLALTYNNVWFTGGGTGIFQIGLEASVGFTNVINDLKIDAGLTVQFFAGITVQVNSLTATGTAGNLITLASTTPGSKWNLIKNGGVTLHDYLSIQDSDATPPYTWYAGVNSTDAGNNTGWIFNTPAADNFLMFM